MTPTKCLLIAFLSLLVAAFAVVCVTRDTQGLRDLAVLVAAFLGPFGRG